MLLQTIEALFRKYRLFCYQKLFAAVRECSCTIKK